MSFLVRSRCALGVRTEYKHGPSREWDCGRFAVCAVNEACVRGCAGGQSSGQTSTKTGAPLNKDVG
jgi:hypothetical protein